MAIHTSILSSFPNFFPSHVTLVNGSTTFDVESGFIDVTSDISLSIVLCLPKLMFNLLSINKISHAYNYGGFSFPVFFFSFLGIH